MNKVFFVLTLLTSLSLVSCGKSGGGSSSPAGEVATSSVEGSGIRTETDDAVTGVVQSEAVTYESAAAITSTSSLPALALSFKTNVTLMNLTATQATKYNKAVAMVKKVVATEAFRTKVLNHTYGGVKKFVDNGGKTNAQIYQSILDAAEKLKLVKNNTMDIGVKMYYQASSTVGYTSTGVTYINVNTKFFDTYAVNQVAGNLFHEWLHKLGYSHSASATASRPYSVPYAIGYMVRDLGKAFL